MMERERLTSSKAMLIEPITAASICEPTRPASLPEPRPRVKDIADMPVKWSRQIESDRRVINSSWRDTGRRSAIATTAAAANTQPVNSDSITCA